MNHQTRIKLPFTSAHRVLTHPEQNTYTHGIVPRCKSFLKIELTIPDARHTNLSQCCPNAQLSKPQALKIQWGSWKINCSTLLISHGIFSLSKELRKDTPWLARKGQMWGVFSEFTVWTNFKLSSFCIVFNIKLYSTTKHLEYTAVGQDGGLLSQFSPFRCFPIFSASSKHTVVFEYHVYISQVSPQLSCGDTCQISIWLKYPNN